MKRLAALLLAVGMLMGFCACGASEAKATLFLQRLPGIADLDSVRAEFDSVAQRKDFDALLLGQIDAYESSGSFADGSALIRALDYFGYRQNTLKVRFQSVLDRERTRAFETPAADPWLDYIETVASFDEDSYYVQPEDCLPREELLDSILSRCELVICEADHSGYYDVYDSEEADENYWWSPRLETRADDGQEGCEEITVRNELSGDFDTVLRQVVPYGSQPEDDESSLSAVLYYKGKRVSGNYDSIRDFLGKCATGGVFYCDNGNECIFFVIDGSSVLMYRGMDVRAIRYPAAEAEALAAFRSETRERAYDQAQDALYTQAIALLDQGLLWSARDIFVALGDYRDSADYAAEFATYLTGVDALKDGSLAEAISIWASVRKIAFVADLRAIAQRVVPYVGQWEFADGDDRVLSYWSTEDADHQAFREVEIRSVVNYEIGGTNNFASPSLVTDEHLSSASRWKYDEATGDYIYSYWEDSGVFTLSMPDDDTLQVRFESANPDLPSAAAEYHRLSDEAAETGDEPADTERHGDSIYF